ncbi:MAG: hypothetical protein ABIO44_03480 [Saprospiraceae bacterium]
MGLDLDHLRPAYKREGDSNLEFLSVENLSKVPDYLERHANFVVDVDLEEYGIERRIYFDSKGYQRKGMQKSFYTDFKNNGIYIDLQSVVKAYTYLEADHISSLTNLQLNFQNNFIDNFIEGESIFIVSW